MNKPHQLLVNHSDIIYFMKTHLLTLTALLIGSFVFGQTEEQKVLITKNYDQEKLAKLTIDLQKEYEANYARAKELAEKNGWETRIVEEDGTVLELKGVNEVDQPIYISTLNEGAARTTKTDELYPGGDLGLELTGEGMTVGVWEIDATRPSHELFSGKSNAGECRFLGRSCESRYRNAHRRRPYSIRGKRNGL